MPEISRDVAYAVARLAAGGVVAIPTETVYGLAADARNVEAVGRVFAIKGRPADHPLIVHIGGAAQLSDWAKDIPAEAYTLARRFWPGPLTLVLKRLPDVPDVVTGGQDTVALRVPAHPLTLELLRRFGGGLAAPSANRFGRLSPTRPEHVVAELDGAVDLILDGGPCRVGLESTILDLTGDEPHLLRPGAVSLAALEAVLGRPVARGGKSRVRAPGSLPAHYAPATPLVLLAGDRLWQEAARQAATARIAVLTHSGAESLPRATVVTLPSRPEDYARELYATLRELDAGGFDLILVEAVPESEEWLAIADRLQRAAAGHRELGGFPQQRG